MDAFMSESLQKCLDEYLKKFPEEFWSWAESLEKFQSKYLEDCLKKSLEKFFHERISDGSNIYRKRSKLCVRVAACLNSPRLLRFCVFFLNSTNERLMVLRHPESVFKKSIVVWSIFYQKEFFFHALVIYDSTYISWCYANYNPVRK